MRAVSYLATGLVVSMAMTLAPVASGGAASSTLRMESAHDDFYLPDIEGVHDREGFEVYDAALPPDVAVWFVRVTSGSDPLGIVVPMRRQSRAGADYRGDVGFTDAISDQLTGRIKVRDGDTVTISHVDQQDGTTVSESAIWRARSRRPDIRQIIHLRPDAASIRIDGAAGAVSPGATVSVYTDGTALTPIASTVADLDGRFTVAAATGGTLDLVWISSKEAGYPESERVHEKWAWLTGRVVLPATAEGVPSQHVAVYPETEPHPCEGVEGHCMAGPGFTNADGRWALDDGIDGVPPTAGLYRVEASSLIAGHGAAERYTVAVASTTTTTDAGTATLAPPNFVLRAVDPRGVPIPEAWIMAWHSTNLLVWEYTGRDGRAPAHFGRRVLVEWSDGDYKLDIRGPHGCAYHLPDPMTISVVDGQPEPASVEVVLTPVAGAETSPDRTALRPFVVDGTASLLLETAFGAIDMTLTGVGLDAILSLGCVGAPLPEDVLLLAPPVDLGLDDSFDEADMCLTYDEARLAETGMDESALELLHISGGEVESITTSHDPDRNILCGTTTSFSAFGVGTTAPATAPAPVSEACPEDTPEDGFGDVDAHSVHEAAIDCAVWWGIAKGTTTTTYDPGRSVSRAQMASFVARMIAAVGGALPADPEDRFTDDDGDTHELAINQLAELGVVKGVTRTTYSPGTSVNRAQMATFLIRAYQVTTNTSLPPGEDRFVDDDTSVHEGRINQAAAAGFTTGVTADTYRPELSVRRDQMASFVARVLQRFVADGHTTPKS